MENFERIETIDEIINKFGETVFGEADIVEEPESFPTKNRTKASVRRKKTYFKGKSRLDRICKTRQYSKKDGIEAFCPAVKGMLKKTNVVTPHFDPDPYTSVRVKDICRELDEKEMISDYYEEAV